MKKLFVFLSLISWGAFVYAQESMVLDEAIQDSVEFFSSKLPAGSTVAVTNFEAETKELSDFTIQELLVALANKSSLKVVERSKLELLENELNFNMSGSVNDETAQGIGRMIGAQILFSGSITPYRNMYRMRIQAIVVETAEIIGIRTINIVYDPTLTGLLGKIDPEEQWKYQTYYAGVNVGYNVTIKNEGIFSDKTSENLPLGFAAYCMYQPFDLFGIAVDIGGNTSSVSIALVPTLTIRYASFEIDVFFGLGIGDDLSYLGGVRGGYHIGPGVVFVEIRPFGNFDELFPEMYTNITVGYQIGFIPRKK
jgi:hypothetical protein